MGKGGGLVGIRECERVDRTTQPLQSGEVPTSDLGSVTIPRVFQTRHQPWQH